MIRPRTFSLIRPTRRGLLCLGIGLLFFAAWGCGVMPSEIKPSSTPLLHTAIPSPTSLPTATAIPFTPTPLPVLAGTPCPQPVVAIEPENAGQVVELARWGPEEGYAIAFSPDGRLLAVATPEGVSLHDTVNFRQVGFLESGGWLSSVAFSPDGRLVAAGHIKDNLVEVWEVESGRLLHTFHGHAEWVPSVAFSPDGRRLAAGGDSTVEVWEVGSGREVHTLHAGNPVKSVAFSPDGLLIASGAWLWRGDETVGSVELWEVENGQEVRSFGSGDVDRVVFSPDARLVAASVGGQVRVWEVENGRQLELRPLVREIDYHMTDVAFSPDGRLLVAGSRGVGGKEGKVVIWGVESGQVLHTLPAFGNEVWGVVFSPDGRFLAAGSVYVVQVWGVRP